MWQGGDIWQDKTPKEAEMQPDDFSFIKLQFFLKVTRYF